MSGDNVTREELKGHIKPVLDTIERFDKNLSTFQQAMTEMQKECAVNSANTLYLAKEIKSMQDLQGLTITAHSGDISALKENQATNNAYWKVAGAAIVVLFSAVVGLGFDRLTSEPKHIQPQPQAARAGIRL